MTRARTTRPTNWKSFEVPARFAAAFTAWRALDENELKTFLAVVNHPKRTHQTMTAAYGPGRPTKG